MFVNCKNAFLSFRPNVIGGKIPFYEIISNSLYISEKWPEHGRVGDSDDSRKQCPAENPLGNAEKYFYKDSFTGIKRLRVARGISIELGPSRRLGRPTESIL